MHKVFKVVRDPKAVTPGFLYVLSAERLGECEKSLSPPVNRPVASPDITDKVFYTTNHQSETGGIACMKCRLNYCLAIILNDINY